MSSLRNIDTLYGFTQVDLSDRIEICSLNCEQCGEKKGVIHILAKGVPGSPNTLTGVTAFPPVLLEQGQYYDVCYKKINSGSTISLPMGQIYLTSSVAYVYPFNRGIKEATTTTYLGEGGDMAIGDELVFTQATDCQMIDDPLQIPAFDKVVFTR